jgi:hypothetical protein
MYTHPPEKHLGLDVLHDMHGVRTGVAALLEQMEDSTGYYHVPECL